MTALHGFLGRSEDWDGLLGDAWTKPEWLDLARGVTGLDELAERVAERATGDVLLGYSMGGRLTLHMLLREPRRWRKAVVVSASPGLASDAERSARLRGDQAWADRFLHDDWEAVVADWNAQAVFAHDPPDRLPRLEGEFDRQALADALVFGSVARQADLRGSLRALETPILWVAGERDLKYRALAAECAALNPLFTSTIVPGAGHRAPWGEPAAFREAVDRFTTIEP